MKSICFSVFLLIFFSTLSFAEDISRTATILESEGTARVKTGPDSEWLAVSAGTVVPEGSVISTDDDSTVKLRLEGEVETALVWIKPNSQLCLATLSENPEETKQNTLLDLAIGEILIKAQKLRAKNSKFEVQTPTSIVGVRGTTFAVAVQAED